MTIRAPDRSPAERVAFHASLAHLAAVLARQGLVVIVAAHRAVYGDRVRAVAPRYVEVHVAPSAAECERRDSKGQYAAARERAADVPSIVVAYEDGPRRDRIRERGRLRGRSRGGPSAR